MKQLRRPTKQVPEEYGIVIFSISGVKVHSICQKKAGHVPKIPLTKRSQAKKVGIVEIFKFL